MSEESTPRCFGTVEVMRPQSRAENCCEDCPVQGFCFTKLIQRERIAAGEKVKEAAAGIIKPTMNARGPFAICVSSAIRALDVAKIVGGSDD